MEIATQLARPAKKTKSARPGRPTVEQAAALTSKLVDIACNFFLRDGYANTSMDAVASEARVSKRTLYARFPNKSELFRAAANSRLQAWSRLSPQRTWESAEIPLEERLAGRCIAVLSALCDPEISAFRQLMQREVSQFPELVQEFQFLGYRRLVYEIATDLKSVGGMREEKAVDPEGVATVIVSALIGWWNSEVVMCGNQLAEAERFARKLVRTVIEGQDGW